MADTPNLPRLVCSPKDGSEPFHRSGVPIEQWAATLRDFWRWACSDLVGNSLRGLVAEYLVARAVGARQAVRVEWDAYDIETPEGLRIEVKTSGYLQSWAQTGHSEIRFDIGRKRSWTAATNTYSPDPARPAHVYVFAVHKHQDKATVDPLDVDQWEFYVVSTATLEQFRSSQKSIRLSVLRRLAGTSVNLENLASAIRRAGAITVEPAGASAVPADDEPGQT